MVDLYSRIHVLLHDSNLPHKHEFTSTKNVWTTITFITISLHTHVNYHVNLEEIKLVVIISVVCVQMWVKKWTILFQMVKETAPTGMTRN